MITALVLACCFSYCLCQVPVDPPPGPPPAEGDCCNDDDDEPFCLFFESPVTACRDPLSEAFFDTSKLETVRFNESMAYIKGQYELILGVQEDTMVEIVLAKEWNGRFDTVMTHQICRLCDEVGNPQSDYYPFLIIFPEVCPFDRGIYKVDLLAVDTGELPIDSKNSGRYKATLNLYLDPSGNCQSDKKFMACGTVGFIIEQC